MSYYLTSATRYIRNTITTIRATINHALNPSLADSRADVNDTRAGDDDLTRKHETSERALAFTQLQKDLEAQRLFDLINPPQMEVEIVPEIPQELEVEGNNIWPNSYADMYKACKMATPGVPIVPLLYSDEVYITTEMVEAADIEGKEKERAMGAAWAPPPPIAPIVAVGKSVSEDKKKHQKAKGGVAFRRKLNKEEEGLKAKLMSEWKDKEEGRRIPPRAVSGNQERKQIFGEWKTKDEPKHSASGPVDGNKKEEPTRSASVSVNGNKKEESQHLRQHKLSVSGPVDARNKEEHRYPTQGSAGTGNKELDAWMRRLEDTEKLGGGEPGPAMAASIDARFAAEKERVLAEAKKRADAKSKSEPETKRRFRGVKLRSQELQLRDSFKYDDEEEGPKVRPGGLRLRSGQAQKKAAFSYGDFDDDGEPAFAMPKDLRIKENAVKGESVTEEKYAAEEIVAKEDNVDKGNDAS